MSLEKCKGCRDLSPGEMDRFRAIEDAFRATTQAWGYREVRTPTLEYLNLFTATGTLTPGMLNRVYSFLDWDGWSGQRVVLRPDGTIPVARMYIDDPARKAPARYSYVVNTFIFEETGSKARERWQCAVELIGGNTAAANVELITLSLEVLSALGIEGVEVRLSHAGIITALLDGLELSHTEQDRIFDQLLDGDAAVLQSLKPENPELVKTLARVLDMKGRSADFVRNIGAIVGDNARLEKPLTDFIATVTLLEEMGVNYQVNLASGRGFEYYTGMIFHLFAGDTDVGGGGRYDALIPQMGGAETPAAGFALYMGRLMGLVETSKAAAGGILIRHQPPETGAAFAIAGQLRKSGFTACFGAAAGGYTWTLDVSAGKAGFVLTNAASREKKQCRTPAEVLVQLGEAVSLKIALPKGRLMARTAAMLEAADWGLDGYHEKARIYRLNSSRFPTMAAKIFHEKDIPIQVAVGNYDLGICGLDWIEELLVKYPSSALVKLKDLGYGQGALFTAVSAANGPADLAELAASREGVRIASEYPNLAESLAARLRLRRFSIFPLWGAAEAYPPDSAELVLLPRRRQEELLERGLRPVSRLLDFKACIIANRESLKGKDLAEVVASLSLAAPEEQEAAADIVPGAGAARAVPAMPTGAVRLALPDGHQQRHVRLILDKAGIGITDYPSDTGNRRPGIELDGVAVKVIRPQDMPLQVANGNFDIAVTGRDWLSEHRHQFPLSPVDELVDLKYGWVKVVAVVNGEVPAENAEELARLYKGRCVRVASEYINIADHYARVNHLGDYRVIPTWGATEAFLPEDADLLIENTETGGTIARHNLKIIDTLFESTACVVANSEAASGAKGPRIKEIAKLLEKAVEE